MHGWASVCVCVCERDDDSGVCVCVCVFCFLFFYAGAGRPNNKPSHTGLTTSRMSAARKTNRHTRGGVWMRFLRVFAVAVSRRSARGEGLTDEADGEGGGDGGRKI